MLGWLRTMTVRSACHERADQGPRHDSRHPQALRRLQNAILAGVDPAAVRDAINTAQAQREAARAELAAVPGVTLLSDAEVYAMIDELGDVGAAIERARPDSLARLYRDLGIEVSYRHAEDGGLATIALRVVSGCVRGGTCTLATTARLATSRA